MIRGTQKQIIHLKNPDSPWFEEAFLIVKATPERQGAPSMVEEASRLLAGSFPAEEKQEVITPPRAKGMFLFPAAFFLIGAALGTLTTLLCLL